MLLSCLAWWQLMTSDNKDNAPSLSEIKGSPICDQPAQQSLNNNLQNSSGVSARFATQACNCLMLLCRMQETERKASESLWEVLERVRRKNMDREASQVSLETRSWSVVISIKSDSQQITILSWYAYLIAWWELQLTWSVFRLASSYWTSNRTQLGVGLWQDFSFCCLHTLELLPILELHCPLWLFSKHSSLPCFLFMIAYMTNRVLQSDPCVFCSWWMQCQESKFTSAVNSKS